MRTKPEWTDRWLDLVNDFTEATRAEPGNLWFEWSRSVDDPAEFVLVEAFEDDGAVPHVNSAHFKKAMVDMPQALAATPHIINTTIEGITQSPHPSTGPSHEVIDRIEARGSTERNPGPKATSTSSDVTTTRLNRRPLASSPSNQPHQRSYRNWNSRIGQR